MKKQSVPVFAVIGHPNEGKSSVLSTLAEDDSVRISPVPGETRTCRRFPVEVDGREMIVFVDTPGFQNPRRTLAWLQKYRGPEERMLEEFIAAHEQDPDFRDECQLLRPVADGAGVIFVVDGSRPLRNVDRAEMEILRLCGSPRLAILNCKEESSDFLAQWQREFRKHFNAVRLFNSVRATYRERIALLESLKVIDQELEPVLTEVVAAFRSDWQHREEQSAWLITRFLAEVLQYRRQKVVREEKDAARLRERMLQRFNRFVERREQDMLQEIRRLFKHNVFRLRLPAGSILAQDIFSETTWHFLGLDRKQLIVTGAVGGAAVGAGIDLAHVGLSFGAFSALGGLVGAAGAALKGKQLLQGARLLGMRLDQQQLRIGPVANPQLMYVLLDRALLSYRLIINWAHGRRDYEKSALAIRDQWKEHQGPTSSWSRTERRVCEEFFQAVTAREGQEGQRQMAEERMQQFLRQELRKLAES